MQGYLTHGILLSYLLLLPSAFALSGHSSGASRAPAHVRRAAKLQHSESTSLELTEHDVSLTKRAQYNNARFTNFGSGVGNCGSAFTDSDFVVAINAPQWNNGAYCGKSITISYQGQTTHAKIMDQCMGCPSGALDLTVGLFSFLVPSPDSVDIIGTVYGSWSFDDGDGASTTTTAQKSTTTTSATPTPTTTSTSSTTTSSKTTTLSMTTSSSTTSSTPSSTTSTTSSSTFSTSTSVHSTSTSSSVTQAATTTTAASSTALSNTSSSASSTSAASASQASASGAPSVSFLEDLTQAYLQLGAVIAAHAAGGS